MYDTIGELYWVTLSYMMRQSLNASYTRAYSAATALDTGFPVFRGLKNDASESNDPMQYRCAANAIVVIGDAHTRCDQRVPSASALRGNSEGNAYCGNQRPLPVQAGVDASTWTTKLSKLPMVEADGNRELPQRRFPQQSSAVPMRASHTKIPAFLRHR